MKKPMIPVGFLAQEAQYQRLQGVAKRTERGVGELLRVALDQFLDREDGRSGTTAQFGGRRAAPVWRDASGSAVKTKKRRGRR